ncbi:MAG: glycosyltransferase family 4 protein, partial [Acidobacteria bacterium]|nr:glycosyltransferase family 4 protein [Acidobacteriota bacterium]
MITSSDKIRILEAITPSKIGGAEVFVVDVCAKLPALGVDIQLFCPAGRPFAHYAEERGISAITRKTHGKLDPATLTALTRLIRREKIDVIHTHLSTASLLGALAARLARVPSLAHVHGLNSATCYRYSTRIAAVSASVKDHLCSQGIDEKKIEVLANGVDMRRFSPQCAESAKASLGYDSQTPLFGVFGRLSPEKGQRNALQALSLLRRRHPDAQLIMAGDGPEMNDLKKMASELGVVENVRFAGFQKDVAPLMRACDAIIVPSLREGFSLAAVEAMALGKVVVASSVGGLREVVAAGETGYLVPAADPPAIARALEELIQDKTLAGKLGAA